MILIYTNRVFDASYNISKTNVGWPRPYIRTEPYLLQHMVDETETL